MQLLTPAIPSSLVLLIRRIINVFSTLTISTTTAARRNLSTESADAANDVDNGEESNKHREGNNSPIALMLRNPALFSPLRKPRLPIALCHGLYGFDVRGPSVFPSLQYNYWSSVMDVLRDKVDAQVIVCGVSGLVSTFS